MERHDTLARALQQMLCALDFGAEAPPFPSIDLAVASFAPDGEASWANVLMSREHRDGLIATIGAMAGSVTGLRFDCDLRDGALESVAWTADSDWRTLPFTPLHGSGAVRVVAPYPASVLKLMVAVGIGLAIDAGLPDWPAALEPMIVRSDNDATTELVALLHRHRLVEILNRRFADLGLHTLQLHGTTAAGGWRNADGAGVGMIHMTAWDTVRLLWLLDAQAPPPPWLPAGTTAAPLLQPATRDHLRAVLQRQQLDEVLSSGALRGLPDWVPGLPDAPLFAHKTGSTDTYAADAGIVQGPGSPPLHYIVAVFTSLGRRHAPHARCATTWRLPALGAALHRRLAADALQRAGDLDAPRSLKEAP
ncbi:MAG: serine hydrolase [Luteimonas sp.]